MVFWELESGEEDAGTREIESSRDEGTVGKQWRRRSRRRRFSVSSAATTARDVSVRMGIAASGVRTTTRSAAVLSASVVAAADVWKGRSFVARRVFAIRSARFGDFEATSRPCARASLVWSWSCSRRRRTAKGPRFG